MMAIKAARAYTGRPKIAKCEGAYHGTYDYAETSQVVGPDRWSGDPSATALARGTPQGVVDDVVVIPFNDATAAERILTPQADQLAAILIDPMPNGCGLISATSGYLEFLRSFSDRHGILLVYDEIIAFRIGFHGAQGAYGVLPDLTTLGKIIGGGFPVGAIAGREAPMSVFDPRQSDVALPQSGTFNANPITMVAGLTAMRLLDESRMEALNALGETARAKLRDAFARSGFPGQVTGAGSLFRILLQARPLSDYRSALATEREKEQMARLNRYLLNHGIRMAPLRHGKPLHRHYRGRCGPARPGGARRAGGPLSQCRRRGRLSGAACRPCVVHVTQDRLQGALAWGACGTSPASCAYRESVPSSPPMPPAWHRSAN